MGLKVNIVNAERIGARKDEIFKTKIWRPLKVVQKNEEEKLQILASVHKLEKDEFRRKNAKLLKNGIERLRRKQNYKRMAAGYIRLEEVLGQNSTLRRSVTNPLLKIKYCKDDWLRGPPCAYNCKIVKC
eukprot:TCONS_00068584-protein